MARIWHHSFTKYLIVGVINTLFGYGIIFALMAYNIAPEIANIIGYALGILLSYALNKFFTFKSRNRTLGEFARFLIAMGLAYALNLIILVALYRYLGVNKYLATIIAGVVYTISGYLLARFVAFRAR